MDKRKNLPGIATYPRLLDNRAASSRNSLDVVPRKLGDATGWPEAAISGPPNATIVWQIDIARFKERLFRALA